MVDDPDLQELRAHSAGDVMPLCVRSGQFAVADISSSSYLSLAPDWTEECGGRVCTHLPSHMPWVSTEHFFAKHKNLG